MWASVADVAASGLARYGPTIQRPVLSRSSYAAVHSALGQLAF